MAQSQGATATLEVDPGVPVTFTDASLTKQLALTLKDVCGQAQVSQPTGAEDFSFFQEQIPGFFFIGGCPADVPIEKAIPNHSPFFYADEGALPLGVRPFHAWQWIICIRVQARGSMWAI